MNNRSYAVLGYLSTTAGAPITLPGESGAYRPRDDGELAMACAHAAETALGLAVDTAADSHKRELRRFYKALHPENGSAAVVIMAHGLAAIGARMAGAGGPLDPDRQEDARRVLTDAFTWNAEAEAVIAELASGVDPETAEGLLEATVQVAAESIGAVVGAAQAATMPGLVRFYDSDFTVSYVSQMAWQIWANHASTAWYQATDPIGLQKRFATS